MMRAGRPDPVHSQGRNAPSLHSPWRLAAVLAALALALALPCLGATPTAYTNPVGDTLEAADPFVLRHEGRYYLYSTGFDCAVSSDLVHWLPLGKVYRRTPSSWARTTFWAPEVVAYRGAFYLVFCAGNTNSDGPRICLARGERPEGPFEDFRVPLFDAGWACIDPDLFIDRDSTPYLFCNRVGTYDTSSGHRGSKIYGVRLSSDLTRTEGEPVLCLPAYQAWEDSSLTGNWCNEGACVFERRGRYYMTYTAGRYSHPGYSVGYATAPQPLGPWTKAANNPILARNDAAGVCGPGHNGIAWSPDNREMFIVYHTHETCSEMGPRLLNIDRMVFDTSGGLAVKGPTRTTQPLPSGAPPPLAPSDLTPQLAERWRAALADGVAHQIRSALRRAAARLPVVVSGSGETYRESIAMHNPGSSPLTVTWRWENVPSVTPAHRQVQVAAGADGTVSFTIRAPEAPFARPAVTWMATCGGDTVAAGRHRLRQARSGWYATTTRPGTASPLVLRDPLQVVIGAEKWSGPADCSAEAVVYRVGDTVVVNVAVTDDSLCADTPDLWQADGIELYLDIRSQPASRRYGPGVQQLGVVPRFGDGTAAIAYSPAVPQPLAWATSVRTPDGYRLVTRIAVAAVGKGLADEFRFDIAVNDNDGDRRKSQIMWSGTRDNCSDVSCFGRMKPVR